MRVIPYSTNPDDFVLAVMLSRTSGTPIWKSREGELALAEEIDLASYSVKAVAREYRSRYGDFHSSYYNDALKRKFYRALFWALRTDSAEALPTLIAAVEESFASGVSYALSKATPISARFVEYSNRAAREYDRLRGFVRLERKGDLLFGRVETEYDVVDIVLRFLERRYPGNPIVLQNGDALYFSKGVETIDVVTNIKETGEDLARLFEIYYDSQYIRERKNIPLMQRFVPKKYWRWIDGGDKMEKAALNND